MKLEQNDMPLLFSSTEIPDVFFTEYFSQANSNYVKVYLYMVTLMPFLFRLFYRCIFAEQFYLGHI